MDVLSDLSLSAYLTDNNLTQLIACTMVSVSLNHGATDASAHGYVGFGLFLGPVFHRYRDGHRFAMLAVNLVEKYNLSAWKAGVCLLAQMVVLWTRPIWGVYAKEQLKLTPSWKFRLPSARERVSF